MLLLKSRFIYLSVVLLIIFTAHNSYAQVYFTDDFEHGLSNWDLIERDWEIVQSGYRSDNCLHDSPDGNYKENAESRILLKNWIDITTSVHPVLTFRHKLDIRDKQDSAIVQIKDNSEDAWKTIKHYSDTSSLDFWSYVQLDLSDFTNRYIKIRLRVTANGSEQFDGWYIDELEVKERPTTEFPFFDNFEEGLGYWETKGVSWGLDSTYSFMDSAYSFFDETYLPFDSHHSFLDTSSHSFLKSTTWERGKYSINESPYTEYEPGHYYEDQHISITLLNRVNLYNANHPYLVFWHKYKTQKEFWDAGIVKISRDGGYTWKNLKKYSGFELNEWKKAYIDINEYKSSRVLIRFSFTSNRRGYEYDGWFIDNVQILEKDNIEIHTLFEEKFEDDGLDKWASTSKEWKLSASNDPFDDLSLNFTPNNIDLRYAIYLKDPIYIKPPEENKGIYLSSRQYYETEEGSGHTGYIEIKTDTSSSWEIIDFINTSKQWHENQPPVNIDSYIGENINLRLRFFTTWASIEETSWYIDNLRIYEDDKIVSVNNTEIVDNFKLHQNYPNPFNPTTIINYNIGKSGNVKLTIFDVLGRTVKTLVDKFETQGSYNVEWDGTNEIGENVNSGVYLYRFEAEDFNQLSKMILLR